MKILFYLFGLIPDGIKITFKCLVTTCPLCYAHLKENTKRIDAKLDFDKIIFSLPIAS